MEWCENTKMFVYISSSFLNQLTKTIDLGVMFEWTKLEADQRKSIVNKIQIGTKKKRTKRNETIKQRTELIKNWIEITFDWEKLDNIIVNGIVWVKIVWIFQFYYQSKMNTTEKYLATAQLSSR